MILSDTTLGYVCKIASICSNCHAVCHGHTCACTSSLACRAVRVYITCKEYWHQLGYACICSHTRMVATKNRLPQNSTYVLRMWCKWGKLYCFQLRIQKFWLGNIREMQSSIVRKYTEPVEPGACWHMKRSEVPRQLHSTITLQMLHQEQKYLGMISTKLLGNWSRH